MQRFLHRISRICLGRAGLVIVLAVGLAVILSPVSAAAAGAPPSFTPVWVQNFVPTHLWSGPTKPAVDYGIQPQWSYFLVVKPQTGPRLFVLVPDTRNYAYLDATTVGPSGPPPSTIGSIGTPPLPTSPSAPPAPLTGPTIIPTVGANSFTPAWVQNFVATHLWSGPTRSAVDYGMKPQWSYFLLVSPQIGPRLYVFVPDTRNYAYLDAKAVGPSGPPPPPPSLNTILAGSFDGQPGRFGIAARNLKTGETTLLNADEFFPSASLYKLAVMYEVFRQQQAGRLSLDDVLTIQPSQMKEADQDDGLSVGDQLTIQQALEAMIKQSNNVAAFALGERVGWENINQSMGTLGFNYTRIPAGSWKTQVSDWRSGESSTSPSDMLAFFQALYSRKLVSAGASDAMLKLLLDQRVNDRIPSMLPMGTAVAHKTGNLPSIVNDAGIVYGPNADFIVVFLSHDVDDSLATQEEASLARRLYNLLN